MLGAPVYADVIPVLVLVLVGLDDDDDDGW